MGVAALFRWLSQKYPKIISPVVEEMPREVGGEEIPVDPSGPNPNGQEFDNLYLDMNGIVHNCSHPDDRAPPSTEADMMLEIFKYTDRVVNMARPRKLLMIAIDGVAPRAKMNQQRSRRFRSAQDAQEKDAEREDFMKLLQQQNGGILPPEYLADAEKKTWDSNAITPGTPFMDILALSLRYWIAYKLSSDPSWEKRKVIISDATVPGEGEHKIMQFVRSQRSSSEHDPNTRHIIYGLDADLIMLGLATHEPHFHVLREDVFFQEAKARQCRICGQVGHKAEECRGEAKVKSGEFDEKGKTPSLKPFIWLHVSVLREYLAVEMSVPNQGFKMDFERAIDDWIFMCFFVGNDFLPHLPSLDIREQGIDTLIAIWRDNLPIMGGYVTKDGYVDFQRAQLILDGLAKQEDAIFRRRKEEEARREANQQAKRRRTEHDEPDRKKARRSGGDNFRLSESDLNLVNLDTLEKNELFRSKSQNGNGITHDMVMNRGSAQVANGDNKSAAAALKKKLTGHKATDVQDDGISATPAGDVSVDTTADSAGQKRKIDSIGEAGSNGPSIDNSAPAPEKPDEEDPPADQVRMWEDGYRDRYYSQKFHVGPEDKEFRKKVARDYAVGLQWVLLYYFQGCPSWTWYYPHHYAPFAADFVNLASVKPEFEKGKPFKPFEQLMGVMPAASNHTIPSAFHSLMTDDDSDIIDFYPEKFPIDLNGKKWAWQGVALLPFIDEKRLLAAMGTRYSLLSDAERKRNEIGKDALYFSENHPLSEGVTAKFYSKKKASPEYSLVQKISDGLAGTVEKNEDWTPAGSLSFPFSDGGMPDYPDKSMAVHYEMPQYSSIHKSMLLRGVQFMAPALNSDDIESTKNRSRRSGRSHGGVPFRGNGNRGGRGGGRGGHFNYGAGAQHNNHNHNSHDHNSNNYGKNDNSRPNPFGAHLNPAFFPNGVPPPFPGQQGGWQAPPGMPPMPMPPAPGQSGYGYGYPQPPPGYPGFGVPGQGNYGQNRGNRGGYQGRY